MAALSVKSATVVEKQHVFDVMTLAFAVDPVARWVWPDPTQYNRIFPEFVDAYAGAGFDHGSVHAVEDAQGFAMWLPPDVHYDRDRVMASIISTVETSRHEEIFAVFGAMGSYYPDVSY